jgi:hypothetical protein
MELLSIFSGSSVEFESSGCATISDLLWMKDKISPMATPLSSLSNSFLGSRGFLVHHGRQQSQIPPKLVDLSQLQKAFESGAISERPGLRLERKTSVHFLTKK